MPINNSHVGEDDLESYSLRALPEDASAGVEEHLLICETCRGRLMEADAYVEAMKNGVHHLRQDRAAGGWRWRWSRPRLVPAFGALALIAIAAVTVPLTRRSFIDNAASAPFAVRLQAMRGDMQARAPSLRPLTLQLDLTGLAASPSYRIEVVDQLGHRVWLGVLAGQLPAAFITAPPQKRGMYFVRVALPSGETLREYGLEILPL